MRVLQLTVHFSPNIGGVETHLDDLVKALVKRKHQVFVLTYRPLTTKASWRIYESGRNLSILRLPWITDFFYKLVNKPAIEFLYLFPGLFLALPLVLFLYRPDIVNAHGLVAGAVGVFWAKIFGKRIIVSTHSIYHFPKIGFYTNFAKWIFKNASFSMGLSKQAASEIRSLGIPKNKVGVFRYWIDQTKFKVPTFAKTTVGRQSSKFKVKKKLGWENKFVVLFVGRLVGEKGIPELLEAVKIWDKNITLTVVGSGPLEKDINHQSSIINHLIFIGKVDNDKLPAYYSAADLVIVPSTHEEGFGRVILEALACGVPVIGSNRGAIPEAMDETVGKLIKVTPENIKKAVEYFYYNKEELKKLAKNARKFAEERYSEKNVENIIKAYEGQTQ